MTTIDAPRTGPRSARPVGVFDSGVGGLTVLHELLVRLPHEDYLYLGDTAHFPYGERDPDELAEFAVAIAETLLARGAKLLVVACNAASAAALPRLRAHLAQVDSGVEVVGVVDAAARLAVQHTRNGRIGLLATPAAVKSGAYRHAVDATGEWIELLAVSCPDLAPLIQSGFPFEAEVMETVRGYCRPLRAAGVDTVILGCTHYPLVAPMLQRMLGPGVTLVGSGESVARTVERALTARGLARTDQAEGSYRFLCTGDVTAFEVLGSRFLQMPLGEVDHVELALPASALASGRRR
jgi:glutamate racemase